MALIPVHHITAANFDVDTAVRSDGTGIKQGMIVGLNSSGLLTRANATTVRALGIAADSVSTSTGESPYAADIIISSSGATRSTQGRVSDFYDETVGSGQMSVYVGGGLFYTDQYTGTGFTPGAPVYASGTTGLLTTSSGGNGPIVGVVTSAAAAYPSGVPGAANSVDGSLSLGTFVGFMLAIQY